MVMMRLAHDGPGALQVGDNGADRLRGDESQSRQIGIGNAGICGQHGEYRKLWRRYTQVGERPFHPVPVRPSSLPQQVAQITIFPAFALSHLRDEGFWRCVVHIVSTLIYC